MRTFHLLIIVFFILSSPIKLSFTQANDTATTKHVLTNKTVEQICVQTPNPSFCHDIMKGQIGHTYHSNTRVADLSWEPMDRAVAQAKTTMWILNSNLLRKPKKEHDPQVTAIYEECLAAYRATISNLHIAMKYVELGNYMSLERITIRGRSRVMTACDKAEFPANVKTATQKFGDLCSIMPAICKDGPKRGERTTRPRASSNPTRE